jgi:hypothetical protein
MAKKQINLDDALKRADDLMAQHKFRDALNLLRDAEQQHFFNESLHDRIGACEWSEVEELTRADTRNSALASHLIYRISQRTSAGLHWYLSGEDDDIRRIWRERVIEEFIRDPENLFRALHFPALPFGRFTHPAVNARLEQLKALLAERGFNDEKLKTLLAKPVNRKCNDKVALLGCALISLVILVIFETGIVTIYEWIRSHHLLKHLGF